MFLMRAEENESQISQNYILHMKFEKCNKECNIL